MLATVPVVVGKFGVAPVFWLVFWLVPQPLPVPTGKASTVSPITRLPGTWPAFSDRPTSTLPEDRLFVDVVMAGVSRVPAGIWTAAKTPSTRLANCHAT